VKLSLAAMNGRALVAWNLKKLRTERGVSQERLAADAGIDRAYLSEIERQLGNASVDLLDRLAGVLGVSVSAFFVRPEQDENAPQSLRSGRRPKS